MPTRALNLCLVAAYSNSWGDRLWLKQMNKQMWVDSLQPQVNLMTGVLWKTTYLHLSSLTCLLGTYEPDYWIYYIVWFDYIALFDMDVHLKIGHFNSGNLRTFI